MKIEVNGNLHDLEKNTSLKLFINAFVEDTRGIAVALNNSVVPKGSWDKILLKESDQILIITATQGG